MVKVVTCVTYLMENCSAIILDKENIYTNRKKVNEISHGLSGFEHITPR